MELVLASRNRKKVEELKKIIESCGLAGKDTTVTVRTPDEFPQCGDVEEDGDTFEANAVKKAVYIHECTKMISVADDSGIAADALGGAPGVFSARYAGEHANDQKNLQKLLKEMEGVPPEKRSARFVCCIALATPNGVKTFMGYVEGTIGTGPRGENGFGYDPVFYPTGHNRTFAEMSDQEKNSMSHRGRALEELKKYIKAKGADLL